MGESFTERVAGRVLCAVAPYTTHDVEVVGRAAELTAAHPASGLVVRGKHTARLLAAFGAKALPGAARQLVIVDPGYWTTTAATADTPMAAPADEEVLFAVSLDEQMSSVLTAGADGVLTPSGFVRSGDWPALKAVLVAGAQVCDPRVATLVATDAEMLDPDALPTFLELVGEQHAGRPLAFLFAAKDVHLATTGRIAGLRALVGAFPGSLVMATEVLAATDALVHGGTAAVGLLSGQRQPRRPGDKGGGFSPGYRPGMFLRELWETRNPKFYVDWYRNRPAPSCAACGRGPESFTADQDDKDAILIHNVHAWLKALTELHGEGEHAAAWLRRERRDARRAHREIGPPGTGADVAPLLAALCDLDGPEQDRDHSLNR
ncbi:MAG: hypothetical protein J0I49_33155 [Pseudonocardia sp.]|jgi:hypothetical protein|uniref:hypothetical protein n=1 Tax=Pseudonocardia sp. TaxID=60912 RepID=UPI001ACC9B33|nr:hypothetical protein [Pseudonocardia sp.]MBN9102906.1 hypothetical protein [Pseudonocardia sp.]